MAIKLALEVLVGVVLRLVVRPDGARGDPGRQDGNGKDFRAILMKKKLSHSAHHMGRNHFQNRVKSK